MPYSIWKQLQTTVHRKESQLFPHQRHCQASNSCVYFSHCVRFLTGEAKQQEEAAKQILISSFAPYVEGLNFIDSNRASKSALTFGLDHIGCFRYSIAGSQHGNTTPADRADIADGDDHVSHGITRHFGSEPLIVPAAHRLTLS